MVTMRKLCKWGVTCASKPSATTPIVQVFLVNLRLDFRCSGNINAWDETSGLPLHTAAWFLRTFPNAVRVMIHLSGSCRNVQKVELRWIKTDVFCLCSAPDKPSHFQTEGFVREKKIQRLWVVEERAGARQQGEWAALVVLISVIRLSTEAHWIMFNLYCTCVDHWHSQIVVPALPGKALKRQLPFRPDEGLFEESFIEERRVGLEQFINRSVDVLLEYVCFLCVCSAFAPSSYTCLFSFCVHVSAELQVTLWPRTSAVFTCSCRRKPSTATTFPEKYGTRVVLWGGGLLNCGAGWTVLPSSRLLLTYSFLSFCFNSISLFPVSLFLLICDIEMVQIIWQMLDKNNPCQFLSRPSSLLNFLMVPKPCGTQKGGGGGMFLGCRSLTGL